VLLEACTRAKVERLVYASSSSVYGDDVKMPMREDAVLHPVSPYGVTKLAAEHLCGLYCVNYGAPAVSLRYFTVYGPRQRPDMGFNKFLKAAMCGAPIGIYGDGSQTRDFTFVADAVTATFNAGLRGVPGRVYNIGGGSRVSVNHVLAIIERLVDKPLNIRHEATQKGDMRDTYADTTLARQEIGYKPSVTLEEGLRAELEWLRVADTAK
jgi:UDP-glucose 4-epimerase